jgi:hypothetical protein
MKDNSIRVINVFLVIFAIWVVIQNYRNIVEINLRHKHVVDSLNLKIVRYKITIDSFKTVDSFSYKKIK